MNTYSLKDISNYIGGNLIGEDRRVSNFSIDFIRLLIFVFELRFFLINS